MAGPDHQVAAAVQVRGGALRVGSGDGETRRDGEVEVALSGEKVVGEYTVTPRCESTRSEQMGDSVIN